MAFERKKISITIPVLNEGNTIGACLDRINEQAEPHEIVVVDGGSLDNTPAVVRTFPGVKCLRVSGPGRGRQMNQNARVAKGDILLFLHSDTLLMPGGLAMIEALVAQSGIVAESFCLRFDHQSPFLRLYAHFSRINHILFTYGDQGLFMTRRVFEQMGDLNLWSADDLSERFYSGKTGALQGTHLSTGDRMWSSFPHDEHQYFMKASPVRPGDYLEFFAEIDLLGALSTCPGGDCSTEHSSDTAACYPLKVEIYRLDPKVLDGLGASRAVSLLTQSRSVKDVRPL